MDTRTRWRVGVALVVALAACGLGVLGLSVVYGFAVEYGGGSFADLALLVVPLPVVVAALAVAVWPRLPTRAQLAVVLVAAAVMVGGGIAADVLGQRESHDRLVEGSRSFTCNGPHAEVRVPAEVDETWRELPRRAPVYGPIGGTATSCRAGVSGDGEQAFADYTEAFRGLDGWRVRVDRGDLFVMTRDDVRVTVRLLGAPDRLTTVDIAVTG